jgi:hypothetical protein
MSKLEAGALIIRNLKLFDDSVKLFTFEIERTIFKRIDKFIEKWVSSRRSDWYGFFEWDEQGIHFAPRTWSIPKSAGKAKPKSAKKTKGQNTSATSDIDDAYVYFEFGRREDDDDSEKTDYQWLTRLCRVGLNSMGFSWMTDDSALGITGNRLKWRAFVRDYVDALAKHGFLFEEKRGGFFLPVEIDSEQLAKAYESETLDDALIPIGVQLDRLYAATGDFTKLLAAAKKEFLKQRR